MLASDPMRFFQTPPALTNTFTSDPFFKKWLEVRLGAGVFGEVAPLFERLGEIAGGSAEESLAAGRLDEPTLRPFDAWGNRIDEITLTRHWERMAEVATEFGLTAIPYEKKYGDQSRLVQMGLVYLFEPSSGVYSCPLAMTDGAARTLLATGNKALIDRALPRLTSRDGKTRWTSGQWMTERTGGSDVGLSETIAKKDGDSWRLHGVKWFTSATTSEMALTLARPEGNPPGGAGLALFYVETRDARGALNGIRIHRLKDKLGTKMVPTAELTLEGAKAELVSGLTDGTKNISPMLAITRTWNALCAAGGMRRVIALATDYAQKREAFGAPLSKKALHVDTLAKIVAEQRGALVLALRIAELLGKDEDGSIDEVERALLRLLVPLAKLVTGKQAVAVASEGLELFGGAGYVEDTGLPRLLRDAQVLPIWEGTTNVLSLDVFRVLHRGTTFEPIEAEVRRIKEMTKSEHAPLVEEASRALQHAAMWLVRTKDAGPEAVEAGARRFALTLGRALELLYLVEAAAMGVDPQAINARTFARTPVDLVEEGDSRELASEVVQSVL